MPIKKRCRHRLITDRRAKLPDSPPGQPISIDNWPRVGEVNAPSLHKKHSPACNPCSPCNRSRALPSLCDGPFSVVFWVMHSCLANILMFPFFGSAIVDQRLEPWMASVLYPPSTTMWYQSFQLRLCVCRSRSAPSEGPLKSPKKILSVKGPYRPYIQLSGSYSAGLSPLLDSAVHTILLVFAAFATAAALFLAPAVADGVNDRVTMIPAPAPPAGTEPPTFPPGPPGVPPVASWPNGAPVPTGTAPSGPVPTATGIPFPPGFERSHARQFRPIDA